MGKREREHELDPRGFTFDTGWRSDDAKADGSISNTIPNPNPTLKANNDSTIKIMEDRSDEVRLQVRDRMAEWRKSHDVQNVREHFASSTPGFSVIEQATGGCLDTISVALAGFKHVGGTEEINKPLGRAKARLFCDMTLAPCLGDARDWRRWTKKFKPSQIDYYKAGMPCTNYASLGDREGGKGSKGGELFVSQAETILTLKPKMFRLEMVPTALETNDGHEVECVIAGLSRHYHVDARILDCWRYGDPTSRRRLIIVGGDRDIVQANWYHWPEPICDENWYPTARDVAIPVNLTIGFTVSRIFIATDYKSKCPLNFRELYILHSTSLPFCCFSL